MQEGKMPKAIAEACKTGRICVLDLTNVKLLIGIGESLAEQAMRSRPIACFPCTEVECRFGLSWRAGRAELSLAGIAA
jgi:hypothetical protein